MSGGYGSARWVEDWRKYRNPANRDDPLDALKFIPLAGSGDVYVTLSGEIRARINLTTNPGLRETQAQRQDIYRLFGGADLHIGSHVRVYGELARGAVDGRNVGTPAASLRNDLTVQQLFADLTSDVGGAALGARVGRQEFVDGPNLLLSSRDNSTIHTSLDGVRIWAKGTRLRADVFDLHYVLLGPGGIGDDPTDTSRRLSGISTGVVLPPQLFGGSKMFADPFLWRLRNRSALWGRTTAREVRVYAGMHFWGDAGPLAIDWTIDHQGGSHAGRSIDAWQVFLAQTYRVGSSSRAPRIGLHADYASGGGAFTTGRLRSAVAPYGNNIYYSYGLFLTPTNLVALASNVTVTPLRGWRVTGEYQLAWRADTSDAVYRANGTAYAATELGRGRRTADIARLQFVYAPAPRMSFTLRLEHLMARSGLRDAGYRSSSFAGAWTSLRF